MTLHPRPFFVWADIEIQIFAIIINNSLNIWLLPEKGVPKISMMLRYFKSQGKQPLCKSSNHFSFSEEFLGRQKK